MTGLVETLATDFAAIDREIKRLEKLKTSLGSQLLRLMGGSLKEVVAVVGEEVLTVTYTAEKKESAREASDSDIGKKLLVVTSKDIEDHRVILDGGKKAFLSVRKASLKE